MKKTIFILTVVLCAVSMVSAVVEVDTIIDNFDADTLDAAWVKSGTLDPTYIDTVGLTDQISFYNGPVDDGGKGYLLRDDNTLAVGQTIISSVSTIGGSGNYVGIMAATATGVSNRADSVNVAVSRYTDDNLQGGVTVTSIDGADLDANTTAVGAENLDLNDVTALYIRRISTTTYQCGYINALGQSVEVMEATQSNGTTPGAAIGYYADMRSAGTTAGFDDFAYAAFSADGEFIQATSAPTIDGAYDAAWADAKIYYSTYTLSASSALSGIDDLRVRYRGMWDATNLYLLVEVVDDAFYRDGFSFGYLDDSIDIYLDYYEENAAYASGDDNIYQTGLAIETSGTNPLTITPYGGSVNPAAGTYQMVVNADSYVLEAAIPWTNATPTYVPAADAKIGFSLVVNDDDDGSGLEHELVWATTADPANLTTNSAYFAIAQLVTTLTEPTTCAEARAAGFGVTGDTNGDCEVNLDDFAAIAADWLKNAHNDL